MVEIERVEKVGGIEQQMYMDKKPFQNQIFMVSAVTCYCCHR